MASQTVKAKVVSFNNGKVILRTSTASQELEECCHLQYTHCVGFLVSDGCCVECCQVPV